MGQAARWLQFIEEYDFGIIHRSGTSHGNCDALSRRPPEEEELQEKICRIGKPAEKETETGIELTPEVIVAEQRQDAALKPLIDALTESDQRPSWSHVQSASEETRVLWAQFASLKMQENMLYREFYSANGSVMRMQIVMPHSLRKSFLRQLHETDGNVGTAHLGVKKTLAHVAQRAYWVGWKTDVENYCRKCSVCQTVQHGIAPKHGYLHTYEANGVGDRLHVDLTGPHPPSRQGSIYILTAIDAYSRFLICVPLKNKCAITVAQALVENVFLPHGSFRALVSDQGREFCNEILESVTALMGIRKLRTTAYRPAANGRIERVHRTINGLFSKIISENQRDWQDKLPLVTAAYNAAKHTSTGYSPYYLVYGREYCTPLDLTMQVPSATYGATQLDYVEQLQARLKNAYEQVNARMKTDTQRMKTRYDAKVRSVKLEPGMLVLYYCPQRRRGTYQRWRRLCRIGRIEKRFNDVLYSIKLSPRSAPILVHIDRLRRYEGEPPEQWRNTRPADSDHSERPAESGLDRRPADTLRQRPSAAASPSESNIPCAEGVLQPDASGQHAWARYQESSDSQPQGNTVTRDEPVTKLVTDSIAERVKRRERKASRPVRFLKLHAMEFENESAITASGKRKRVHKPRTEGQKQRRREINQGPFTCAYCSHAPFRHRSGYRRHIVLQHNMNCSWAGNVTPFESEEQEVRIRASLYRSGCHRKTGNVSRLETHGLTLPEQQTVPVHSAEASTTSLEHTEVTEGQGDAVPAIFRIYQMPNEQTIPDNNAESGRFPSVTTSDFSDSPLQSILHEFGLTADLFRPPWGEMSNSQPTGELQTDVPLPLFQPSVTNEFAHAAFSVRKQFIDQTRHASIVW